MRNHRRRIKILALLFFIPVGFVIYKVVRSVFFIEEGLIRSRIPKMPIDPNASGGNAFSSLTYTSYDQNSQKFSLQSSSVEEKNNSEFEFQNLVSHFKISDNESGTISAKQAEVSTKDERLCTFIGNVKLTTDSGLQLTTEKAFTNFNNQTAEGDTPVIISQKDQKFSANKYFFDAKRKLAQLEGNVQGNMAKDSISSDKLLVEFDDLNGGNPKKVIATGNSTYKSVDYILKSSESLEYNKNFVDAKKNVRLHYKKGRKFYDLKSDFMRIELKQNRVKKANASGHIFIKTETGATVSGNKGVLENDMLTITDSVKMTDARGTVLCDKVVISLKTGSVAVSNSKGIIRKKN